MKKGSPHILWQLFKSTFMLSAFTFGGGYVIVPLMRKTFVDKKGWLDEDEMLDITALAQSAPGPIAVNASILVGYRLAGVLGAFITTFGTVLPPLIIISIISLFYEAFRDNKIVSAVLKGMQAGVAAVIVDVVIDMGGKIVKSKDSTSICIMLVTFVAVMWFDVHVALVIITCGVAGAVRAIWNHKRGGEGSV